MSIDEKLNTSRQATVAKAVASLPDEQVSMVWRSELNQALLAQAQVSKKRRFYLNFLSPMAGLGVACTLALIVLIAPPKTPQSVSGPSLPIRTTVSSSSSSSSLEASLVHFHQDDVRNDDVAGPGLNPTEAATDTVTSSDGDDDGYDDDSELF